jgi:hypothetical protein
MTRSTLLQLTAVIIIAALHAGCAGHGGGDGGGPSGGSQRNLGSRGVPGGDISVTSNGVIVPGAVTPSISRSAQGSPRA